MISIILPVYNLEAYIQRTLDALCAQTYKDLEIIAVDDGSNDNSGAILDEYAKHDSRVKVIHQANGGVSAARNTGIAAANGEYIGFCDGDDIPDPSMYERLLDNLLKYDADVSHCGMCTEGMDGHINYFYNTGKLYVHDHNEGLLELLKAEKVEPTLCDKLYKRELFKKLSFDATIKINEDLLMNAMLFKQAQKSIFEDVCLYHYIRHENSASKSAISDKHVFHPVIVRERILELCKDENPVIQAQAKHNYIHANISTYSLLTSSRAGNYSSFKKQYQSNLRDHKAWIKDMSFSTRSHAKMIIYVPWLNKIVSDLYYIVRKSKQYG